jgi:osmoprotectant transport system ATP-binding protein
MSSVSAQPLVEFRNVWFRIEGRAILRGINLAVAEGETVVFLGRSGSGKTTLLKTVNRLVDPGEGEIWFRGKAVHEWDPIRLRRQVGYVIQEGGLLPHITVERNIGLVPSLDGWQPEQTSRRVAALLEMMGLPPHYASRYPRELSGGEKQRVGIARALAADPPLLLLDEPFAALDPVTRFDLQRQFLKLRDTIRQTALFVTHDIREALMLASRIALVHEGRLEIVATPADFSRARTPEAVAFLRTLEHEWTADESRTRQ